MHPQQQLVALVLAATALISCQSQTESPDTIVLGQLVTMNPQQPQVEAVAIKDGRFIFVGEEAAALALADSETTIIDLQDAAGYPGFIDAHLHVAGIGSALQSVNLADAESFDEIVQLVADRARQLQVGTTVVGHGWHQSKWPAAPTGHIDGFPTHIALSAAVPSHPVILEHANGHSVLLNRAAMDQLDITAKTVAPKGGVIVMRDGSPTGLLHETAIDLTAPLRTYDQTAAEQLIELAQRHLLSQGITTAHDAGALREDLDAQRAMAERGDLRLRLYSMVLATDEKALAEWLNRGPLIGAGDDRLTVRSIKVQADGALGSRTAWLHEPYSDAPHTRGVLTYDLDTLSQLIANSRADNWQVNVHAIGDRANSEVLSRFAPFSQDAIDPRFRIEHAQHLRSGDAALIAEHGIIASMQPIHLSSDRPWAIDRLGQRRIESGAYVWRDLLNEGVVVASGTDAPVEPVNPIANFYAAVTRKTLDGAPEGGFEPKQRLSRMEALHTITMAAAYAGFEEHIKGSIEVGKLADLTILSADILAVPEEDILDTTVVMTIVGGAVEFAQTDRLQQ